MSQRRLPLPDNAGTITGCPTCLNNPESQKALRDLVAAAKAEWHAVAPPEGGR